MTMGIFDQFWDASRSKRLLTFPGVTIARCEQPKTVSPIPDKEEYSCEFASPKYFALCGLGGIISCGTTHTAVVPLDMVKCRIQVNPAKYKGILSGFSVTLAEEGFRALGKGWAPTFIGYSLQGLGKFGFYEIFKVFYSNILGEEKSYVWRTSLYLAASASAEFFADILLAPMEASKVRIQTQPGCPPQLRRVAPNIFRQEGLWGFYKGLGPLWMRQIPYTMMKFACFERTLEMLYRYVVPKPRSECSKPEQLCVTFVAGYIAGVFCALVSHPADSVVSKLNQDPGSSAGQVLRKLGWKGVWKGLFPRIIMIGTLTALQWFIYDFVKVTFRMPRPPPPEMPESLRRKYEAMGKPIPHVAPSVELRLLNNSLAEQMKEELGIVCLTIFALFQKWNQLKHLRLQAHDFVAWLQSLIEWLMGAPGGLKLNKPLNTALGKLFISHLALWRNFMSVVAPVISHGIFAMRFSCFLGLSVVLALICDMVSLLSVHLLCFAIYAARLFHLEVRGLVSMGRLFRGTKYNPLRKRVDSCTFDVEQLLLGSAAFTVFFFLFPTTLTYYAVFCSLRLLVLFVVASLRSAVRFLLEGKPPWKSSRHLTATLLSLARSIRDGNAI
ncbi:Gpi1 and Mito carr domain containing protein [Trichuris trichiura]|uniref:Phosphate carrier protein, mitochondrial n=1 Tax=Trichuris trichiura TaxID=36087 RepID=A0A077Z592_TRITR|nr:Gpi1 and Mito carr domain containing protein [Trichuris trichiura]